jgi:hypothetical protein
MVLRRVAVVVALALPLAAGGCGNSAPPSPDAPSSSTTPAASTAALVPSVTTTAAPVASSSAGPDAPATEDGGGATTPAEVADNKVAPTEGPELQARARGLFDAIVKDDPELAEAFWFPKRPFIPLKDIKDPGKYWEQLHRAYKNDVHALHKKRKSWDGAEFVSFEGWSKPKWVPPGDEANHIGYHRAFNGMLRFKAGGEDGEVEVHTLITWQGRWFVTHLRRVKK